MDRFDEMRARGVGTGGGTAQTTGIIPMPVPYLNMKSVVGEKGKQRIEVTFPDGATSIDLYLKEGSYPLATNDVCYQKESFDYAGETTTSKEITLNAKADGSYPYKLYGWAVSKNKNGVQTAIGSGNRRELDVYYASGGWDSTQMSTSVTSYSGTTDVTVDGNLAFINTCAGLLLLDLSENSLKLLVEGNFTEKPTVLNPRTGVYLIKSDSWYEYNVGANTTTLLSDLGTNTFKGEYGGYYFFTANINYKKSSGAIITSCENASGGVYITSDGAFCGVNIVKAGDFNNGYVPYKVTVKRLNLSIMSYYDVGYYYENGEKKEIGFNSYGSPDRLGSKITDFDTNDLTILMYTWHNDTVNYVFSGWLFNGDYFEEYNTNGINWGNFYNVNVLKYDICGLGSNLIYTYPVNTLIEKVTILAKATKNGFVKVADTSGGFPTGGDTLVERIASLTIPMGKCDLLRTSSGYKEYRYNKETNTVYLGTANFSYGKGADDTTHSTLNSSDIGGDYLGYYSGKHWRAGSNGLYYLRDDSYWQRIIYNTAIVAGNAVFNENYIYIKDSTTTQKIIKALLETNGTVETINTPTFNNFDKIELKNINGLIYIIPRIERRLAENYSNYTDFISIYNPADGTVTKSTTLRGGIPWGENKYLSLNGSQISNVKTGEVEKVPTFNSTRIVAKNLFEYTEPYNGLSLNVSFTSGKINLMYAQ